MISRKTMANTLLNQTVGHQIAIFMANPLEKSAHDVLRYALARK